MKRLKIIVLATLCCAISTSVAIAQTFMTDDELMEMMVNKTIVGLGQKANDPFVFFVNAHKKGKPKGKVNGYFKGNPYGSRWKIKKGEYCEIWKNGGDCWRMEKISDTEIQPYGDKGETKFNNLWIISEGSFDEEVAKLKAAQ